MKERREFCLDVVVDDPDFLQIEETLKGVATHHSNLVFLQSLPMPLHEVSDRALQHQQQKKARERKKAKTK